MVLEEDDPVGAEQRRILKDIENRNTASLLFDEEIYPPLSSGRYNYNRYLVFVHSFQSFTAIKNATWFKKFCFFIGRNNGYQLPYGTVTC
jgi:hypothetical protein